MWLEITITTGLILSMVIVAMKLLRSKIYNIMIVHLTTQWYGEVLDLLDNKNRILDVGIGTGQALMKNKSIIIEKDLKIEGVDYDVDYVKECQSNIRKGMLQDYITVYHTSILDFHGGPYDAIYFSASLMILPNPVQALSHVKNMLTPSGKIYVTQTIEKNRSFFVELIKPLLKYISTIDFGNVTYEDDLLTAFKQANLNVKLNKPISGTSMGDARSFRLFVLESLGM